MFISQVDPFWWFYFDLSQRAKERVKGHQVLNVTVVTKNKKNKKSWKGFSCLDAVISFNTAQMPQTTQRQERP